jgi:hypothetical protein
VQSLIAQHLSIDPVNLTRDDLIEILRVAAARYRSRPPSGPLTDSAKLHWCLVAFRALRVQNQLGVQRAVHAFPTLPLQDLEDTIVTIKVADSQLHNGPPHCKKSEAAGNAYMQKIVL